MLDGEASISVRLRDWGEKSCRAGRKGCKHQWDASPTIELTSTGKPLLLGSARGKHPPMSMCAGMKLAVLAMHAPDGLFSMPVNIVFAAVVGLVLAGSLANLLRRSDHRLAPTMGVMAAFIFAAQMVNFPIASGTTGHLLGGTLAAILLGPWAGAVVMAVVVIFQATLGDGGVTALGPNIFNMGVVGSCLAYFVYRLAAGQAAAQPGRVVAAAFFASWLAVVLASVFVSIQLAVSGTASLSRTFTVMVVTHMAIGVGEAMITAGVVAFLLKTRPDLIHDRHLRPIGASRRLVLGGALGVSLVVGGALSLLPMLWDHPDGLESVGMARGFLFEECERSEDGKLLTLPAYPIGVRLSLSADGVTAVHRYDRQAGPVETGDTILAINGLPTPDLAGVAAALRFDEAGKSFGTAVGEPLTILVNKRGQQREERMPAAAAPLAGAEPPLLALLPDYTVPGLEGLISTSLAGVIGTMVMFIISFGVGRIFTRPSRLEAALSRAQASAGGGGD